MKTIIELAREAGFAMENSAAIQAAETFATLLRAEWEAERVQAEQECPNLKYCEGQCFTCIYFNSETGKIEYPAQPASEPQQEPHKQVGTIGHIGTGKTTLTRAILTAAHNIRSKE